MAVRKYQKELPFDYPSTPPPWLPEWPSEQDVRDLFAPGIRQHAPRIVHRSRSLRVSWNADSLSVDVGNQHVVWRLVNGTWRRNCSCGYKNDRCVHTYAAARIFAQIIEQENWLRGYAPESGKKPRQNAPRHRIATDSQAEQLPLWGHHLQTADDETKKVQAEVDFHHQPGKTALRFYLVTNGRRRLLRLQQLYNQALRMRHSEAQNNAAWSDADQRFLRWLPDRLRGKSALRQNLKLLKLEKRQFEAWQDIWAGTPGRFIERASQQVIGGPRVNTAMHIELRSQPDDKVEIALLVTTPDGAEYPYHVIYEKLITGSSEAVIDGRQLVVDSPFSYNLLKEVFSRKQPLMPRSKVTEFLPALLENRLDLVFGPIVEHRQKEADCHAYAMAEGGAVLLSFKIAEAQVHPDTMKAAGNIQAVGDKFVIYDYISPGLDALRHFIRQIEWKQTRDSGIQIPGKTETIAEFALKWGSLPATINRHVDPSLSPLLSAPLTLRPELICIPRGTFVDVNAYWRADGVEMTHPEVSRAVAGGQRVVRTPGGTWAMLDLEETAERLETIQGAGLNGHARLFRPEAQALLQQCVDNAEAAFAQTSESIGRALLNQTFPAAPEPPAALTDILRHYQADGFAFLADRSRYGLGAILADDMGLGKTLQVLAFLAARQQQVATAGAPSRPSLVICPASVTGIWKHETEKFPLNIQARIYAGKPGEREPILRDDSVDLLIVNYALLRQDADTFNNHQFDVAVLDEAQYIKNPGAQVTQAVKALPADQRVALTGTPLENRALDLWSIMDYLNPGYLGTIKEFTENFEGGHGSAGGSLGQRIAPVMLRRTKEEVAPELPPRTEEQITIELGPVQRELYREQVAAAREILRDKGPIEILAALTRLRQICCHPGLLDEQYDIRESAKMQVLREMLSEITSEGHSALVFSQFASVLKPIRELLESVGIDTLTITGQTPSAARQQLIDDFTDSPSPQVFLLSLKAAGTGLTLTKADYVFLFDPWWNPAVERQAIDRTHRIGQDKPVMAYRLVAQNTVEENVMKLQQQKAELFDEVMQQAAGQSIAARLSTTDLQNLLATSFT